MIDLLSPMQAILQESNFRTRLISLDREPILCFEDETIIGFTQMFDTPGALLSQWHTAETNILMRFARSLRDAPDKAWNVYCVFLCPREGDANETRQIRWIEEDLERTRKIACSGVATREDLVNALLAILPIQHEPRLQAEDSTARLIKQIRGIAPKAVDVALDQAVAPAEVIRLMSTAP
jgi:hypothetical protein